MLAVIPSERGCKVRCLTCGRTGPERESTDLAWDALMRLRGGLVEEEAQVPNVRASYGIEGRGNRDQSR